MLISAEYHRNSNKEEEIKLQPRLENYLQPKSEEGNKKWLSTVPQETRG